MKLSSVIIAKNEENNIARCLKSQAGVIDEILLLVDQSTEDNTAAIANALLPEIPGLSVSSVKWEGYSKTKQAGLDRAGNRWVFWIDADEEITTGLREELCQLKKTEPEYSLYSVPRKAYFLGRWIKHCGWYPGRTERLFDKERVQLSKSLVHEHLEHQGPSGELHQALNHYTDPDIRHYFKKFNEYTSLASRELFDKGRPAGLKDLIIRPLWQFKKMYFLKLGFLDGIPGLILSVFSACYVFTKYAKLWELKHESRNSSK